MKGLALEYPVSILILLMVVVVAIGVIMYFSSQAEHDSNKIDLPADVKYACTQLNDTKMSFQDFQSILYGFLTGQCNNFVAETKQRITASDIERVTKSIDSTVQVIQINKCKLPDVNSHKVYINFSIIDEDHNIYLTRKEIDNSDVLICG